MKFWTIQSREVVDIINKKGIYYPDFKKSLILKKEGTPIYCEKVKDLYTIVLNSYNNLYNENLDGLVFAFLASDNLEMIEMKTYSEFKWFMQYGYSCISDFWEDKKKSNSVILELEFDLANTGLLPIDLNDFQYLMPEVRDMFPYNIEEDVPRLLENIRTGIWHPSPLPSYLLQVHLPYISAENILNMYEMPEISQSKIYLLKKY